AIVSGMERLGSVTERIGLLARPEAAAFPVRHPYRRAVLGRLDMRRPLAPFRRHPRLPDIGRQHVEVERVVATDEGGFEHASLQNSVSLRIESPGGSCNPRAARSSHCTKLARRGVRRYEKRAPLAGRPSIVRMASRLAA